MPRAETIQESDGSASTVVRLDAATWKVEGHWIEIQYSNSVLRAISAAAVDRFLSIPRGGLEIGGVLFGRFFDQSVEITAYRPFAIEYLSGPSYSLSATDKQHLRAFLDNCGNDPELAELEVVGWYHSHTRSEICLSEADLEIYNSFFPLLHQISLVLKPYKFDPVQFGFFFRHDNGSVKADATYQLFTIGSDTPTQAASENRAEPFPVLAPAVVPSPAPQPVVLPKLRAPQDVVHRQANHAPWLWAAGGILVTIVMLWAGIWNRRPPVPDRSIEPSISSALRLLTAGDEIRIEWDRGAAPVLSAVRGQLFIRDGEITNASVPLDVVTLRTGNITYARQSGDLEIRMLLYSADGSVTEEVAQYIGNPVAQVAKTFDDGSETARSRLAPQVENLPAATQEPRARAFRLPVQQSRTDVQSAIPNVALPSAPPVVAQLGSTPSFSRPAELRLPSAPRPEAPESKPPVGANRTPAVRSGRAIWTGNLRKGGLLLIEGGRPSMGALTGSLPNTPAKFRVYPAELVDGGMVIHTDDAAHRDAPVTEAPAARNGWNVTTFNFDPKRNRLIRALESPTPQNNWKRLVLQTGADTSVIVLDWQTVAQP